MFRRTLSTLTQTARILTPGTIYLSTVVLLNDHFYEILSVNGDSMVPSLSPSYHETGARDFILLQKYGAAKRAKPGDIVAFWTPHLPDRLGIKRVVAGEGEWVDLDWRRRPEGEGLGTDGEWEEGLVWESVGERREGAFGRRRVRVPVGHVWVEGDNARKSRDSNWYGPISKSLIMGKAVSVVWPPERFGTTPWEGYKVKTKVQKDPHFGVGEVWQDLL